MLLAVGLCALADLPPALANCDGCPPVAWKVVVELADGTSKTGFLAFHFELVTESISFEDPDAPPIFEPPTRRSWDWRGEYLQLWEEWAIVDTSPIEGYFLLRSVKPPSMGRGGSSCDCPDLWC